MHDRDYTLSLPTTTEARRFLLALALIILLALALGYLLASANTEAWYAANTLN